MSCAKMAEPIEMSFVCGLGWVQGRHVLDGVLIGAIRLNRPCAAAMQPFRQITLTTYYYYYSYPQ